MAFPLDEAIDARSKQKLAGFAGLALQRCLTGPSLRTRQTAESLGCVGTVDPALQDCDYGRWAGRSLESVQVEEPASLAQWMADPASASHGGESVVALISRVGTWLDLQAETAGAIVAITHAAVIRAAILHALGAPARSFGHIDVAPLSVATLSAHGGRWTLAGLGPLTK